MPLPLTMVNRPETRDDTRSFPALAVTMVLWAPDTAGPWSADTIRHISMNLHAYVGSLRKIQWREFKQGEMEGMREMYGRERGNE